MSRRGCGGTGGGGADELSALNALEDLSYQASQWGPGGGNFTECN